MAFNTQLEEKLDLHTKKYKGLTKKKMFGGMAYLINGNMSVGINKDLLMIRISPAREGELLKKMHVRPMDFTGKRMKGWLTVEPEGWDDERILPEFVAESCEFAASLPPK
jgi:TfoX/Sxy family transcriptional regulator of competence genes